MLVPFEHGTFLLSLSEMFDILVCILETIWICRGFKNRFYYIVLFFPFNKRCVFIVENFENTEKPKEKIETLPFRENHILALYTLILIIFLFVHSFDPSAFLSISACSQ